MSNRYYGHLIIQSLIFFLIVGAPHTIVAKKQSANELAEHIEVSTQRGGWVKDSDKGRSKYRGSKKILKEIEHVGEEVTGVGKKVNRVDTNVKKVEKKVRHVDKDVENIENIVTNIQNQIGDCYNTTVCSELEDISNKIGNCTICETLSIIESKIDALDICDVCDQASVIESVVDSISNKIGDCTVCETLSIIESKIDALDICNVCDQTSVIESVVDSISNKIGDCTVCETLSIIESKIDALDICNACDQTSIIESVVESISNKIGDCTVCETLSIIESKIDALDICNVCDQTSVIESVVDSISNKIGGCTLCDEIATIENDLSIIDSKIDILLIEDACSAMPITAPITITQPGSYCLANDIMGTITIAADNVSINLNDFSITSETNGIESNGQNFITIQNGTIHAADYGILFTDMASSKIVNCDFQICGTGCGINQSQQIIIDNCRAEANANGFSFLESSTCIVRYSIALDHTRDGFLFDTCFATVVTGCIATGNTVGYTILNSMNTYFENVVGNANGFHGLHSTGGSQLHIESSSFNFNTGLLTGVLLRNMDTTQTCSGNGVTTTNTSKASGNNVSTSYNNGDGASNEGLAAGFGNFTNWISHGNKGNGILVINSNNVSYQGHCRNNGGSGIAGDSNNGLTINLDAEANQEAGAQISNTNNLIASGNYSTNIGHGFDLGSSTDFLIKGAVVIANGQNGVNAAACQNGQLVGNTINTNTGNGIHLDEDTTACTINNCTSLQNGGIGLNNLGGTSNALYGNDAKSNTTNFNGVTNKYVAINEFQNSNHDLDILSDVNNLPPQTIIINNPGVYTMTRTFSGQIIIDASNVTLDLGGNIITGNNSQTSIPIPAGIISVLPGNSNVTVRNGTIELVENGNCPFIGINIDQTNNVNITDFIINNHQTPSSATGIDVSGTSSLLPMNDLVIDNVVISNFTESVDGIDINFCDNVVIRQYTTNFNGNSGLAIADSTNGVIDNCSISHNTGAGAQFQRCSGYTITNSPFSLNLEGLIFITCTDCSISNCAAIANVNFAFSLTSCTGCDINKCLTDGNSIFGIGIFSCQQCTIDNCRTINSPVGFLTDSSQNCVVKNSHLLGSGSGFGIHFSGTSDSFINYCFSDFYEVGIVIESCTDCSIENCKTMNNEKGIAIINDSSNCEVKSCVANSNSISGFEDDSDMSTTDRFINNIAHTNGGGTVDNYINISPTTTDQVNGGFYNNLSI